MWRSSPALSRRGAVSGLAAEGHTFYIVPADHYNCPIGSYTHNIPLPPAREPELMQTLSLMSEIGYIRLEEVPGVPRLAQTPGVVIYSPLAGAPVDPDVVVIAGRPGRLMLLQEAAVRAQQATAPMLGRPTCMAIPAALASAPVVSSLGCVGNRVYTSLGDDQNYVVVNERARATRRAPGHHHRRQCHAGRIPPGATSDDGNGRTRIVNRQSRMAGPLRGSRPSASRIRSCVHDGRCCRAKCGRADPRSGPSFTIHDYPRFISSSDFA